MPCALSLSRWLSPCLCAHHEMQIKFLPMQVQPVDLWCSCDDWRIVLFACCSTKEQSMQHPRSTTMNCICETVPLHFPPEKTTKDTWKSIRIVRECHQENNHLQFSEITRHLTSIQSLRCLNDRVQCIETETALQEVAS